jgi:hypothetical protein
MAQEQTLCARSKYLNALRLIKDALEDKEASMLDATLLAVIILGYYENITSDNDAARSIQSWRTHINGAMQLIRMRGTTQFSRHAERALFRENRHHIMAQCILEETAAPSWVERYQAKLSAKTPLEDAGTYRPSDEIMMLYVDYVRLRAEIRLSSISNSNAIVGLSNLEQRAVDWSKTTTQMNEYWRYHEVEVYDNHNVRDGRIMTYTGSIARPIWNKWRCLRIMLSRTQQLVFKQVGSVLTNQQQLNYYRKVRMQMASDICATVSACLGYAGTAQKSPCPLPTAFGLIWPLFFAGTCAIERIGYDAWSIKAPTHVQNSAAFAQASWVLQQLEYQSQRVGLKWAEGVAAPLRGEFRLQEQILAQKYVLGRVQVASVAGELICACSQFESWKAKVTTAERSPWMVTAAA